MKSKVTLTMEKSVVEIAKAYAESQGMSFSDLVENYLKSSFTKTPAKRGNNAPSTLIKSLKGSFKAPDGFNYKEELYKELSKKYKCNG
jgi:hypothetical protein